MPVKRLFVEGPLGPGQHIRLEGDAAHYLGRVLRARRGDLVRLFDGTGAEYEARVVAADRGTVTLDTLAAVDALPEPAVAITLIQALSRNEKMDLAIQKAVELGVSSVRPVAVTRSVMKLDGSRADRRHEHWRQVAVHAAQQSGRAVVPEVHAPAALDAVLGALEPGFGIVADPRAAQSLSDCLAAAPEGVQAASLLVGPEGGLTDEEIAQATAAGFHACRAGPRVMRTETAALALVAALQLHFGDLGRG